jgi:hypothetical protein
MSIRGLLCSVAAPVSSRASKKVVAFIGGVALAGSVGACSGIDPFNPYPRGQGGYVDPMRYQDYAQRYVEAEASYAAPRAYPYQPQSPVASSPSPSRSWGQDVGNMAMGAGVGAVGGALAGHALSGAESHAVVSGAEHAAEKAAEKSVATRATESAVTRGVGAAALTAAEEAEGAEILEFVFTRLIWLAL